MLTDTDDKTINAIAKLAQTAIDTETFTSTNGRKIVYSKSAGDVTEIDAATKDDHGLALKPPARIVKSVTLQEVNSLVDYVVRFKGEGAMLFADIENDRITAILDYHKNADAVDFAAHRAVLDLPFSEEWNLWAAADDDYKDQLTFARFLEENGGDVAAPTGAEMLECCRDLQALRSANFKSAVRTNTNAEKFSYEEDSQLVSKKDGFEIEVPTKFQLSIPVYFNGEIVSLFAFLRWKPEGRGLKLAIKRSRAEHVRQAVFKQIVEDVASRAGVPVVYGEA